MKVIQRPPASTIAACNAPELPPPAYSPDTTYGVGAQVSLMGGPSSTTATVYESLTVGNLGYAPASYPALWLEIGTVYAAHSLVLPYAAEARVTGPDHMIYIALQSMASGHALSKPDFWKALGPSNRQKMLGTSAASQTARPNSLSASFDVSGRIDSLALINVTAAAVTVKLTSAAGEVFNETFSMTSDVGINDWHSWLFDEVRRKRDLIVLDLPNDANPTLAIEATGPGMVGIGVADFGQATDLGATQYGLRLGFSDYSRMEVDAFGDWFFQKRKHARRMSFAAYVEAPRTNEVHDILTDYLATPVTVIGTTKYTSAVQFGVFKSCEIELRYVTYSVLSIEFQGI